MTRGVPSWVWWALAGAGGLWMLTTQTSTGRDAWDAVMRRVDARIRAHEGTYDSLNLNTDNAGLSVGVRQWAQRPGGLGRLLSAWGKADPEAMVRLLGPSAPDLLLVVTAELDADRMKPVDGAVLWAEPWVSRFRAAGADPSFRRVQDEQALAGDEMRDAIEIRDVLGLRTERGFAVALDRAVQQGPSAKRWAQQAVRAAGDAWPSYDERARLDAFIVACVERFRRRSPPTSNLDRWREVSPGLWHYFSGRVDLYRDIMRRSRALLDDAGLSDVPVAEVVS